MWTKYDSRIRSDEINELHDMEQNDQNEIRQRHNSRHSNNDTGGDDANQAGTMEMTDRKSTLRGTADDNSRVPLMSRNALYLTDSSNDSMTNQG